MFCARLEHKYFSSQVQFLFGLCENSLISIILYLLLWYGTLEVLQFVCDLFI